MVLTVEQILAMPEEPDETRENLIKPDFGLRLSLPEMNLYRDLAAEVERLRRIALQDQELREAAMVGQALWAAEMADRARRDAMEAMAIEKGFREMQQIEKGFREMQQIEKGFREMQQIEKGFLSSAVEMSKWFDDSIVQQAGKALLEISRSSMLGMWDPLSWRPDVGPTIIKLAAPGTFMGDVQIVSDGSIEQSEVQAALDRLIAKKFPYWRVFPGLQAGHPFQQELWPKVAKPALYEAIRDMPGTLSIDQLERDLLVRLARQCGGLSYEGWASVQVVMAGQQNAQAYVPPIQVGGQLPRQPVETGMMKVTLAKRVRKTVRDRREKLRELHLRGLTAVQMAEALGCGESTVRNDCKEMGLSLR